MDQWNGKDHLQRAAILFAIAGLYVLGRQALELVEGVGRRIVAGVIHSTETRGQELALRREMSLELVRQEARQMGIDPALVAAGYQALVVRNEVTVDELIDFARDHVGLAS